MLGEAFYMNFRSNYELKCTDIDVNENWLNYCDIRSYEHYYKDVVSFRPDYLFHLGAYTDLEYCELHPEETYITNTLSVENAVYISNELGIPLLYISTAGIFDGKKDVYDDWDTPNPLGVYARSKFAAEQFVLQNAQKYFICRAGWMMGGGPEKDKKFINKIMNQLKIGKKELFVVNDRLGTPTYTHDFARNVRLIIESRFWGLYNIVCRGTTSRLDVARMLISILGLQADVKLTEVNSNYFKNEYFAERPESERLMNMKLNLRGINIMRDWTVALQEYLENYYQEYLKTEKL